LGIKLKSWKTFALMENLEAAEKMRQLLFLEIKVGGSGDEDEVVVMCATFESNEASRESTALPNDATADDFLHLPYCFCGYFEK